MSNLAIVTRIAAPARCFVISIALATLVAGCSGTQKEPDVEANRAREALETALDAWKSGKTPASLQQGTPPITAQDKDWGDGAKLLEYKVTGEGESKGANLVVPVTLTLRMKDGKQAKKDVTYLVATSPSLMIFRSL